MRMAGPREALLARDHPQELRLHPLHRRPRPRRPRQRRAGQAVLRPLRRPGAAARSTRTSSASRWCRSRDGLLLEDRDTVRRRGRGPARRDRALDISGTELRRRLPGRARAPGLVHLPRGGRRAAPQPTRRATTRASRSSSPASPAPASRTIANALLVKLLELGGRPVTLLDGDIVRKHLSSELGFSQGAPRHQHPAHRLRRRPRSPRTAASPSARRSPPTTAPRKEVRDMIEPAGGFVLVHVATPARGLRGARPQGPLRQGPRRHPQGVHRHLRPLRGAGEPGDADRHVRADAGQAAHRILLKLESLGFIK